MKPSAASSVFCAHWGVHSENERHFALLEKVLPSSTPRLAAKSFGRNFRFDLNIYPIDFDHDYDFKLPFRKGSGAPESKGRCSTTHHAVSRATPRANRTGARPGGSSALRHSQYKLTANLRAMAAIAMLRCRRMARF